MGWQLAQQACSTRIYPCFLPPPIYIHCEGFFDFLHQNIFSQVRFFCFVLINSTTSSVTKVTAFPLKESLPQKETYTNTKMYFYCLFLGSCIRYFSIEGSDFYFSHWLIIMDPQIQLKLHHGVKVSTRLPHPFPQATIFF